ncbi:SAM-dependent methyltransferase [Nakamurella lactea]|uniref:SAM-dependent methyltransferase n=1 Tax=Nakamurella lactea TaxID=459515 RepID=UPI0003FA4F2E|nr:cyclopropane-fatty-acyl-phospholipid synthase family protein [Nakamurella lactea]
MTSGRTAKRRMVRRRSSAERLLSLVALLTGTEPPVRVRAWDGSEAGSPGAPLLIVHSRSAVRRLLHQRGELGLARAYVAGELDVEGDLYDALARLADTGRAIGRNPRLTPSRAAQVLRDAVALGALGPAPAPPAEEVLLSGVRHSRLRDRAAITHHYDVGNDFYQLVLGPSMVYSCAYFVDDEDSLAAAQAAKLDLVCRKLGLRAGMRVLDVGCGWGSFALHAAREYGVEVVGITLSEQQVRLASQRGAEQGLSDRVEFRLQDWRELDDGPFDAISSIGMAEHVGEQRFGEYTAALRDLLRPGGRLLNHQINRAPGDLVTSRTFIDAYVFPDGALLPLSTVVTRLEDSGLEVRDVQNLREHYVRTLRGWVANLDANWDECVALTSPGRARVWRLYMTASALGFARGWLRVNQTLVVRPHGDGASGVPPVRADW